MTARKAGAAPFSENRDQSVYDSLSRRAAALNPRQAQQWLDGGRRQDAFPPTLPRISLINPGMQAAIALALVS